MKYSIYIVILGFFLVACSTGPKGEDHSAHTAPASKAASSDNNALMLTDTQLRLANVTTQKVSKKPVGQTQLLNAVLAVDEENSQVISTRIAGRVEKLFFKETGRAVRQGEPLYEIYSEELLTLQQEFLLAKEQFETLGKEEPRYESFLKTAEKKLVLYGMNKNQIEQLRRSGIQQQRISFLSPSTGIITEINAAEGQYVGEGSLLYRIENTSRLWVEAELYPNEARLVKVGDKITVRINGYESTPLQVKVVFLSPEYRANTQIMVMRGALENRELTFKPGMQAQVLFTHSSRVALSIPVDAVIRDENGTHVYVESGKNTFEPRMVKTGIEDFDQVEITEGLMENEVIAATGAYLLYSEFVLKRGTDPMAGHHH
ncbi:MAG TPA: efflux RND transporter periplasmic adaptor subunit [Chryseolinea sp.]